MRLYKKQIDSSKFYRSVFLQNFGVIGDDWEARDFRFETFQIIKIIVKVTLFLVFDAQHHARTCKEL